MDGNKRTRRKLPQIPLSTRSSSDKKTKGILKHRTVTTSEPASNKMTEPAETASHPAATPVTTPIEKRQKKVTKQFALHEIANCKSFAQAMDIFREMKRDKLYDQIIPKAEKAVKKKLCQELALQLIEQFRAEDDPTLAHLLCDTTTSVDYVEHNWLEVQGLAKRYSHLMSKSTMVKALNAELKKLTHMATKVHFSENDSFSEIPAKMKHASGSTARESAWTPVARIDAGTMAKEALERTESYKYFITECMDLDELQSVVGELLENDTKEAQIAVEELKSRCQRICSMKVAQAIYERSWRSTKDDQSALEFIQTLLALPQGDLITSIQKNCHPALQSAIGVFVPGDLSQYLSEKYLREELRSLDEEPLFLGVIDVHDDDETF